MKKNEFIKCEECNKKFLKKKLKRKWQITILKEREYTYEKKSLDIICSECGKALESIEAFYKTLEGPEKEIKGKVF